MAETSLRRRRNKYNFRTIEPGKAYEELRRISVIPSHKHLLEESIFNAVSPNFMQLKEDISSLYDVIERDVVMENRQIALVELQLTKSLKKVNHAYRKVLIEREQNKNATHYSRMWESFVSGEDKVQVSLDEIEKSVSDILDNIMAVDSRFPKKNQMLSEDVFSKQHYPILFQLINDRCHKSALPQPEEETSIRDHNVSTVSTLRQSEGQFLPPTLRKTCPPSTSTTVANIRASEIITIKRS